jgi:hypothetical protein
VTAAEPTLLPSLLGALAGALTGAISGGLVGLWLAPSRAEREERGRKRVDARRDAVRIIGQFDTLVRSFRQRLYRLEKPDPNDLETGAVRFANEIRYLASVLPRWERWLLLRRVRKIVGPGYWREAELRPQGDLERSPGDAIALAAVADARPFTSKALMSPTLALQPPTDEQWDELLAALAALRRSAT